MLPHHYQARAKWEKERYIAQGIGPRSPPRMRVIKAVEHLQIQAAAGMCRGIEHAGNINKRLAHCSYGNSHHNDHAGNASTAPQRALGRRALRPYLVRSAGGSSGRRHNAQFNKPV